jgi:hypothetical protein
VYVAGACSSGRPLDPLVYAAWVARIAEDLSELSGGGCTVHAPAEGRWRGRPEPVQVVEAFVPAPGHAALVRLVANRRVFGNYLAATHQEAVLVVVDGTPYLLQDDDTTQERHP